MATAHLLDGEWSVRFISDKRWKQVERVEWCDKAESWLTENDILIDIN